MTKKVTGEQVLFESNYSRVFRAVYLYCGSHELTEDTVQEAFTIALKKLHQLRNKESFAAWVTSIAINIIRETKKGKITIIPIESAQKIACSKSDYDYDSVEQKDKVNRLLNSLDEIHREVLILHYLFDLTLEEISEIQKVNKGTVKSRINRAKEKIRKYYEKVVLDNE